MTRDALSYEQLPAAVRHNLTAERWNELLPLLIDDGAPAPETGVYMNVTNGQLIRYEAGEAVCGPLLAAHALVEAWRRSRDDTGRQPGGMETLSR